MHGSQARAEHTGVHLAIGRLASHSGTDSPLVMLCGTRRSYMSDRLDNLDSINLMVLTSFTIAGVLFGDKSADDRWNNFLKLSMYVRCSLGITTEVRRFSLAAGLCCLCFLRYVLVMIMVVSALWCCYVELREKTLHSMVATRLRGGQSPTSRFDRLVKSMQTLFHVVSLKSAASTQTAVDSKRAVRLLARRTSLLCRHLENVAYLERCRLLAVSVGRCEGCLGPKAVPNL